MAVILILSVVPVGFAQDEEPTTFDSYQDCLDYQLQKMKETYEGTYISPWEKCMLLCDKFSDEVLETFPGPDTFGKCSAYCWERYPSLDCSKFGSDEVTSEPEEPETTEEIDCEDIEDDLTGGSDLFEPEEVKEMKADFEQFTRALLDIINGAKASNPWEIDRKLDELFSSYYPESTGFLNALRNIQDSGIDVPGDLKWDYLAERSNNIADTVSIFDIAMNKWKAGDLGNIEDEYVLQRFLANTANGFKNPEGPYSLDYIMQNALQEAKRDATLSYARGDQTNIAAIATVERYKQNNEFTYFMEDEKDDVYEAMTNPEFARNLKRMHDISQGIVEARNEQEELAAIFSTMIPGVDTADITASATYSFQEGNYLGTAGYAAIGTMGLWLGPITKPFKEIFEGTAKGAAKAGLKARLLSKLTKAGIIRQVEKEAVQEVANAGKRSIFDWFNPELKDADFATKKSARCFDPIEDAAIKKVNDAKSIAAKEGIPEHMVMLDRDGNPAVNLLASENPADGGLGGDWKMFPVSIEEFKAIKNKAAKEGVPINELTARIQRDSDGALKIKTKESATLRPEVANPKIKPETALDVARKVSNREKIITDQIKVRVSRGDSLEKISKEFFGDTNVNNIKQNIRNVAEGNAQMLDVEHRSLGKFTKTGLSIQDTVDMILLN